MSQQQTMTPATSLDDALFLDLSLVFRTLTPPPSPGLSLPSPSSAPPPASQAPPRSLLLAGLTSLTSSLGALIAQDMEVSAPPRRASRASRAQGFKLSSRQRRRVPKSAPPPVAVWAGCGSDDEGSEGSWNSGDSGGRSARRVRFALDC